MWHVVPREALVVDSIMETRALQYRKSRQKRPETKVLDWKDAAQSPFWVGGRRSPLDARTGRERGLM